MYNLFARTIGDWERREVDNKCRKVHLLLRAGYLDGFSVASQAEPCQFPLFQFFLCSLSNFHLFHISISFHSHIFSRFVFYISIYSDSFIFLSVSLSLQFPLSSVVVPPPNVAHFVSFPLSLYPFGQFVSALTCACYAMACINLQIAMAVAISIRYIIIYIHI